MSGIVFQYLRVLRNLYVCKTLIKAVSKFILLKASSAMFKLELDILTPLEASAKAALVSKAIMRASSM